MGKLRLCAYFNSKGKARENRTNEGPRTGVRTSGRTISTLGYSSLLRAGPGGGSKKQVPSNFMVAVTVLQ